MTVLYHSTRGMASAADFRTVALGGLAPDGGLYVPQTWPQFAAADLAAMKDLPYADIAARVLSPFTAPALDDATLHRLAVETYAAFDDPAIAPLRQIDGRLWLMELFHGPTLAFKDIALQLLGRVFEYFLGQGDGRMTVIGATSGDTGSAAMTALAGRKNIDVFILYPQKGPSEIQRRQMTCIDAPNTHALAIDGTFDDCQRIVKALFNDVELRARHRFAAVNSINALRILAQMVYYFAATARLGRAASFAVPTGNFGNIYAAYAASKCGLPAMRLAVASNRNDILARFFASGRMQAEPVQSTLSPSMDIQVSSNFERLLFDLCDADSAKVRETIGGFQESGAFEVSKLQLATARQLFTAGSADDELTLATIRDVHRENGLVIDPHTAVGVAVARKLSRELPEPVIVPATAHPAKFPETIKRALGTEPPMPPALAALLQKPEQTAVLPADVKKVAQFIEKEIVT
ncbi:MAG TPA: threonine synthase [Alphaproteobacteria bacterium]|nr:threonine synthase [Alphaproteobacteria bacterium]